MSSRIDHLYTEFSQNQSQLKSLISGTDTNVTVTKLNEFQNQFDEVYSQLVILAPVENTEVKPDVRELNNLHLSSIANLPKVQIPTFSGKIK